MEKRITDDMQFIKQVKDFSKSLKEHSPPINENRGEYLQNNVYNIIEKIFEKYGLKEKWKNPRNANIGEWHPAYKYLFLNRDLLPDEDVRLGVYEDIIYDKDMSVCVEYYALINENEKIIEIKKKLNQLEKALRIKSNQTDNPKKEINFDEENMFEYLLTQKYSYQIFFQNVEKIMEFHIKKYKEIFDV